MLSVMTMVAASFFSGQKKYWLLAPCVTVGLLDFPSLIDNSAYKSSVCFTEFYIPPKLSVLDLGAMFFCSGNNSNPKFDLRYLLV